MKEENKEKPAILFVHGACGSGNQFYHWSRKLSDLGYKDVYCPDLLGHGKSSESLHGVSIWDYVSQITSLIRSIHKPVCVVGHSLGGLIAQLAVSQVPDLVKACVLLASTPDERPPFVFRSLKPRYLWAILTGRVFTMAYSDARYFFGKEFGRMILYPESGKVIREELFGKCPVKPLTTPTLVFASMQDRFFPIAVQQKIAVKHSAQLELSDCGHMIHLSDREGVVLGQLVGWIEKL